MGSFKKRLAFFAVIQMFLLPVVGKQRSWLGPKAFLEGPSATPRYGVGLTSFNNRLYVQGGYGLSLQGSFSKEPFIITLSFLSFRMLTVLDRKPFNCTSLSRTVEFNDIYVFDPPTNTWTDLTEATVGTPPPARSTHGFTTNDGRMYVTAGYNGAGECESANLILFSLSGESIC